MAGTGWTSNDLLQRFAAMAGLPAQGAPSVAQRFGWLADGESEVINRIAAVKPSILYGAPTAMTTADGGLTFTFGTDGNGYALFPMGQAGIYPSLNAIPGGAWVPGQDYLDEGTTIRMVNATPYTGTLYWYGITPKQQMSASVQPVLYPPPIRMLSVIWATKCFAEAGGIRNERLSDRMEKRFEKSLGETMTMLRKHFKSGGGLGRLLGAWGVGEYGPGWSGAWW